VNFNSLTPIPAGSLILARGTPVRGLSLFFPIGCILGLRERKGPRKGETNVKKIILASLLGTVVILAAQTPKPAESAKPSETPAPASNAAAAKKHQKHHKKSTAVSTTTAKPAAAK
jgi:hypothetical protein